ncbi:MAG: hypothetical protein ACE5HH_01715 [Candidatus Hydrothermarchaeales archaeon]
MGRFIPIAIVSLLILAGISEANAVITLAETTMNYTPTGYRGGISSHVGEICVGCHTRFSKDRPYANELPYNVSKDAVLHIFPCSKPACHRTPPTRFAPRGTARWTLHLKICDNCHPRWNSSYETIHNTHLNFSYLALNRSGVECKLCHATPLGYNSSVVHVPPFPGDESEFIGKIFKPQWEGECSYCHFTINGAERVHDVHEPVLLEACPICHSSYILKSKAMFDRIDFPYPFEEKKPPTVEEKLVFTVTTNESIVEPEKIPPSGTVPILSEFYLYFNEILERLLEIYSIVV